MTNHSNPSSLCDVCLLLRSHAEQSWLSHEMVPLLHELEDRARGLGYTVARLDTGPKQPVARGLYESEGYVEVANFNGNPVATFFGEKPLG